LPNKKQNAEVCDATKLLVAPMPVTSKINKPFKNIINKIKE